MYSLNAPVPSAVARLASGLAADLLDATVRERHTLVVKRLGEGAPSGLSGEVRRIVAGTDPFPARVTGVDVFDDPGDARREGVGSGDDTPDFPRQPRGVALLYALDDKRVALPDGRVEQVRRQAAGEAGDRRRHRGVEAVH